MFAFGALATFAIIIIDNAITSSALRSWHIPTLFLEHGRHNYVTCNHDGTNMGDG
jgi:hypothetical protein